MRTEETMTAEKIRRERFVTSFGNCQDCGQPVLAGQEFHRSDDSIQHALCFYDPAFAKRMHELQSKTGQ
jgi:hypothetical protein